MGAGQKSAYLVFEKKIRTTNERGQHVITWSASAATGTFTEWAEPQHQSETSARFIIDYREGINSDSHRILWNGSHWIIVSVSQDRRRRKLFIECDLSSKIEVTNLQSDTREFIDGLSTINE